MRSIDPAGRMSRLRQEAMRVLVASPAAEIERLMAEAGIAAEAVMLRGPETGLVTVKGRIGGGGDPFNVGEATVTRATVRLGTGEVGHSYALGRDGGKARMAATIDALMQRPGEADRIEATVLVPLRAAEAGRRDRLRAETAATKVDFFTMVRGED